MSRWLEFSFKKSEFFSKNCFRIILKEGNRYILTLVGLRDVRLDFKDYIGGQVGRRRRHLQRGSRTGIRSECGEYRTHFNYDKNFCLKKFLRHSYMAFMV